jgi:hypothetical protein
MAYAAWMFVVIAFVACGTFLMLKGYGCSAVFLWLCAAGTSVTSGAKRDDDEE